MESASETRSVRNNTVAAVILAAGLGERFEGPTHKLLSPFRGKPVLKWVLEAASGAGFDDIYLVSGAIDFENEQTLNVFEHEVTKAELMVLENNDASCYRGSRA